MYFHSRNCWGEKMRFLGQMRVSVCAAGACRDNLGTVFSTSLMPSRIPNRKIGWCDVPYPMMRFRWPVESTRSHAGGPGRRPMLPDPCRACPTDGWPPSGVSIEAAVVLSWMVPRSELTGSAPPCQFLITASAKSGPVRL